MINLVWDKVEDDITFILYTKTFIPMVYADVRERVPQFHCYNDEFVSEVMQMTGALMHVDMNDRIYKPYRYLLNAMMMYIIEYRHLDDYWVQSRLMKEL